MTIETDTQSPDDLITGSHPQPRPYREASWGAIGDLDLTSSAWPEPMNASPAPDLREDILRDPRFPVHEVAERLLPYLRVLVQRVRPLKVILFGSYAYGMPDQDSDFDLLVIRRGFVSEKASNLEIRRAFREVAGPRPGFTVITKTPEQVAERLAKGSPLYQDIVGRGLEVYAA